MFVSGFDDSSFHPAIDDIFSRPCTYLNIVLHLNSVIVIIRLFNLFTNIHDQQEIPHAHNTPQP